MKNINWKKKINYRVPMKMNCSLSLKLNTVTILYKAIKPRNFILRKTKMVKGCSKSTTNDRFPTREMSRLLSLKNWDARRNFKLSASALNI